MQFSFDKFFQMIEERFGRRVANRLLLLVAVAIAVLALSIIIVQGIVPTAGLVSEFMRGGTGPFSSWVLSSAGKCGLPGCYLPKSCGSCLSAGPSGRWS